MFPPYPFFDVNFKVTVDACETTFPILHSPESYPDHVSTSRRDWIAPPGEAFWYAVTVDNLQAGDMKMLIPAKPFTVQQAFNTLGAPEESQHAGNGVI